MTVSSKKLKSFGAMAETQDLPEEIILNIFSRLPVKSLIRFTSVSKGLHFIILSDPEFAQSQLKAAPRFSRRLLVSTDGRPLESLPLDADTPSFGDPSSVRKLTFPFLPQWGRCVQLLGSCNGLVFLSLNTDLYYIWNPSTGFFKKLPDPCFRSFGRNGLAYGVGYLSSTDDYRVFIAYLDFHARVSEAKVFSLRTHIWERIKAPGLDAVGLEFQGTLFNCTVHWLNGFNMHEIVCFDLAVKEFRKMWLPDFDNDGKSFCKLGACGGRLCVCRYPTGVCDSIDLWVMREYGVSDSWTMLSSSKVSNPPELRTFSRKLLVVETSTVAANCTANGFELIRIDHKEDHKVDKYMLKGNSMCMVEYEESLLWISGYHPVQQTEQVQTHC